MDLRFDQTADGEAIKLLNVIDEFTRECLAIDVDRSITADTLVSVLERLAAERGTPGLPTLGQRSRAHCLCPVRLVPFPQHGHGVHRPWLPMAEPWVESFNGRLRDEL